MQHNRSRFRETERYKLEKGAAYGAGELLVQAETIFLGLVLIDWVSRGWGRLICFVT